jgi:hypothetical protein
VRIPQSIHRNHQARPDLVTSWSPRHRFYLWPPPLGSIHDTARITHPLEDQQFQVADRGPPGLDEQLISVVEILQLLRVREAVSDFGHCLWRVAVAFVLGEGLERGKMCWNR